MGGDDVVEPVGGVVVGGVVVGELVDGEVPLLGSVVEVVPVVEVDGDDEDGDMLSLPVELVEPVLIGSVVDDDEVSLPLWRL